jgi:hypothetical protein
MYDISDPFQASFKFHQSQKQPETPSQCIHPFNSNHSITPLLIPASKNCPLNAPHLRLVEGWAPHNKRDKQHWLARCGASLQWKPVVWCPWGTCAERIVVGVAELRPLWLFWLSVECVWRVLLRFCEWVWSDEDWFVCLCCVDLIDCNALMWRCCDDVLNAELNFGRKIPLYLSFISSRQSQGQRWLFKVLLTSEL